ncbi:hypothetical protein M430DRAFT_35385 [Amorphotheca resinae ATCC 22711]|uniref:Pyridoxamine 5'-phosphate oxidase Alr4036 family FMN-binding domain-containing protein n=1 Tax=Amorphotheca resinae ATCC 22711 TaxID=857342 RepID=A0A2T3AZX2_AMORE|nr:hypothetical protein M430DRAFT_35385 [Amorphotheca resinae ATCC 22711]PSS16691.1 hypothetical protein M430DRAFT_35385 [Amorphotheca resinae ATCC 22711]
MSTPSAAPWRSLFLSHLSHMPSPEFVLATLRPSTDATSAPTPRARYCIFRGLWAELTPDTRNPAPPNPRVYESDLLTLTTDVRMSKIEELGAGPQSGGGAIVEAVFWARDVMAQWRFRGPAYVVGPDIESGSSGATMVREQVGRRMRIVGDAEEQAGSWSWERELAGHFGNLSPTMRGSFRNPPPGARVDEVPADGSGLKLGQKVTDVDDAIARRNFRVVVIRPDEVEQLDLTDPERARRWKYTCVGPRDEWTKEELWP